MPSTELPLGSGVPSVPAVPRFQSKFQLSPPPAVIGAWSAPSSSQCSVVGALEVVSTKLSVEPVVTAGGDEEPPSVSVRTAGPPALPGLLTIVVWWTSRVVLPCFQVAWTRTRL